MDVRPPPPPATPSWSPSTVPSTGRETARAYVHSRTGSRSWFPPPPTTTAGPPTPAQLCRRAFTAPSPCPWLPVTHRSAPSTSTPAPWVHSRTRTTRRPLRCSPSTRRWLWPTPRHSRRNAASPWLSSAPCCRNACLMWLASPLLLVTFPPVFGPESAVIGTTPSGCLDPTGWRWWWGTWWGTTCRRRP